jgi:cytosine/adenosine deaminase-related metal-dependent hydrolase
MSNTTYQARWILPVTSDPIENGCIVVDEGRITSIGKVGPRVSSATDLGDVVLLPGFVNAHTHLELSFCRGCVPYRGSFVGWLQDLTALLTGEHATDEETLRESLRTGIRQSLAAGVTAVADIGHNRNPLQEWARAPLHTVGFLEVLGMGSRRAADHKRSIRRAVALCEQSDASDRRAARAEARGSLKRVGISPHAPYSTDTSVYREAITYAVKNRRPICTHLAESREEGAFLADGTGPLRELLEMWNLWDGSFAPPACSPIEYASRIGLLGCDPLLAHVNYVTDHDLQLLKQSAPSIVYCPRTHAFFGHEPHRWAEMIARGLNVCIGTDSLASNDTLSVLDELRFVWRQGVPVRPARLLAMGTTAGARALGWHHEIGSLEPGKRADFVTIPLAHRQTGDPIDDLLSSDTTPAAVYLSGDRFDDASAP